MNKKIAVICNYELLPERVGGMDYFFWSFDQKCKENEIEVDWFFPNISDHGSYSALTIYSAGETNVENSFLTFLKQNKSEYTHVITHFVELCTPFFFKISKFSNANVIAVDHNPRPLEGYTFKKKISKKIKGIIFSHYIDTFIAVSNYSKKELLKDFGNHVKKKIKIIPNGLDLAKFKKKVNFASNNKFITACHLRKEKGIQDLINAVKEINENYNFEFLIDIYGDGNFKEDLNKMIAEYSLQHIFTFKGSVSDLNAIYFYYDYLIHPSHGETFCYSVLESLLSNLPVITTRNQGNVLGLVKENRNGFLFEVSQIDELKEILINILNQNIILEDNSFFNDNLHAFSLTGMVDNYFDLFVKE